VILATLVLGSLGGFAGAVLALPVTAIVKVIIMEVYLRDRVAEGDPVAAAQLEKHDRAEAAAEAEARERAHARRRLVRRFQDRFGRGRSDKKPPE
jgi:hypothetical protein